MTRLKFAIGTLSLLMGAGVMCHTQGDSPGHMGGHGHTAGRRSPAVSRARNFCQRRCIDGLKAKRSLCAELRDTAGHLAASR